MIQLCLAEKDKASIQRCFPLQNREYGIANTHGAKRGFEAETLYISEGGKPLEGLGVTPDETIALTQADLLAGRDTVLDRAVAWIKSH